MNIKIKSMLWAQFFIILLLITSLFFVGGNLKEANKMLLSQSNYCIRYTSEITTSSRLDLIREQEAHKRTVDDANKTIKDIIYRYNSIAKKYKKELINEYSFIIFRSAP